MLVVARKNGEFISIGNIYEVEVLGIVEEGKHKNKLKVKLKDNEDNKETNLNLTENLVRYKEIEMCYVNKNKGKQYHLGIVAPSEMKVWRGKLDNNGEEVGLHDLEEYKEEFSWFYR